MTDDQLADLRRLATRRRRLTEQLAANEAERDPIIRAIMRAKATPIAEIMAASGLSKPRLYQIRDDT